MRDSNPLAYAPAHHRELRKAQIQLTQLAGKAISRARRTHSGTQLADRTQLIPKLGFGLEQGDAVGSWTETEASTTPIGNVLIL